MNNNLKEGGIRDRGQVNLGQTWEITYWTKHFNCSEEELRKAEGAVGNSAEAIENYFNNKLLS